MIRIKSDREIALMRNAGRIVAQALRLVGKALVPGMTTEVLDERVARFILEKGGVPAFKGYRGFPGNICASINEEVVHGIPSSRKVAEGDLLSVDVGVKLNGYYGDTAMTFAVGKVSKEAKKLMKVCRDVLEMAVTMLQPGKKLSRVCAAIQENVEKHGFSVIREYVGHGIGNKMHEEPQVPNFAYDVRRDGDVVLKRGMVLAIEPMISAGDSDVEVLADGWTAVTRDRHLSVHFEHTIAVREGGGWALTRE